MAFLWFARRHLSSALPSAVVKLESSLVDPEDQAGAEDQVKITLSSTIKSQSTKKHVCSPQAPLGTSRHD
jgi:hypothetical protein